MSTDNEDNKFTWNDLVKIKENAPEDSHPGEIAVIVGMEKVKSEQLSKKYNISLGKWLYTIEFDDGSDISISEDYLDKFEFIEKHSYEE